MGNWIFCFIMEKKNNRSVLEKVNRKRELKLIFKNHELSHELFFMGKRQTKDPEFVSEKLPEFLWNCKFDHYNNL